MSRIFRFLCIVISFGVIGCTGLPYRMASVDVDSAEYEVLGEASADAGGVLILGVFPSRLNDKIERAVEAAIHSKGGDELINITVQERWWWGYVVTGYRVNVSGTVLKKTSP